MSRNGIGVGEVKKWKNRVYCLHGNCKSNTQEAVPDVFMIPFTKPCNDFYRNIIDPEAVPHIPEQCEQCNKVLRWIHLCKRDKRKTMTIFDISTKWYICSKHFYDASGPTDEYPDPFSTDLSEEAVYRARSAIARRSSALTSIAETKPFATAVSEFPTETTFIKCEVDASAFVKVELVEHDPLEATMSYKNIAATLFKHDVAVKYNRKSIQATVNETIRVVIKPSLDVEIDVDGIPIPSDHEVWTSIPRNLRGISDEAAVVVCFQRLGQWNVCPVWQRGRLATRFQDEFGGVNSDCDEVTTVLGLAASCLILCRNKTTVTAASSCVNCKAPMIKLRKRAAKRASRDPRKSSSSTNVKYLTREESHHRVRQLRHALRSERLKVARMRRAPAPAGNAKVTETRVAAGDEFFTGQWDFES